MIVLKYLFDASGSSYFTGYVGIGNTAPDSEIQTQATGVSNAIYAGLTIGNNATSNNYYDADAHYFRIDLRNSANVNFRQFWEFDFFMDLLI